MKLPMGGENKTGMSRAPELAREMIAATEEFRPSSRGSAQAIADVRAGYARSAEPIGTMPPPAGLKDAANRVVGTVTGAQPSLLLDKLGERLVFEAAGTRLYDALLSKYDAGRTFRGGPARDDLLHIRNEEHAHFTFVGEAIVQLGGDPTVVTPSANLQATASKGLPAVLADPRTDLLQCLEAILVAELVDNDCWPALVELAEQAGATDLVERMQKATADERDHLAKVRAWVAAGTSRSIDRAEAAGLETRRTAMAVDSGRGATAGSGSRARGAGRTRKTSAGRKRSASGGSRAKSRKRASGGKRRAR